MLTACPEIFRGGPFTTAEATDGPSCPELIGLLGERPWGPGRQAEHVWCTCGRPVQEGCTIDFRLPGGRQRVYYSPTPRHSVCVAGAVVGEGGHLDRAAR